MPAKVRGQVGMDETVLDDPALETALEDRLAAQIAAGVSGKAFRTKDSVAKAEVIRAVPVGSIVRVGRFRVERKNVDPRHVEFDTEAGERVSIAADK